ncbi:MAG: hypothetical protein LUE21_12100 [Oscillospiraceae bacterium]|nr:hypothetical protein [Oscillospiraceae bacterium]
MSIVMLFVIVVGTTAGCQMEEEADSYAASEEKYTGNESDASADIEEDYTESEENTSYADVDGEIEDISESEQTVNIYALYAEVVQEYEDTYGELEFYEQTDYNSIEYTGVFLLELVDFDQDGIEELIIGYSIPDSFGQGSVWPYLDVWRLEDGEPVLAYEGAIIEHGDISRHCAFTLMDGKYYLLVGQEGYDINLTLLTLVDGEFVADMTIAFENSTGNDVTYTLNGYEVDEETCRNTYNQIYAGCPYYYYSEWADGCFCGTIFESSTYTADDLIDHLSEVKQLIGLEEQETDLTAYASVVQQYEDSYGTIGYNTYYQNQEAQTGEAYMLTGLCLVQPIDFDGDSVYELLIGYGETVDASTGQTEVYGDVWGLDGDTPVLLYSGASFPGESYYNAIAYKNEDGVYYLYDGYSENRFAHVDIYCLTDGSFTKVYTLEADFSGDSPLYTLNGTAVSMTEYAGYVSDGLTEFYAQVSSLEAFETCRADLESTCSEMGLQ